jgi:arginine exporter protein ArgO
MNQGIMLGFPRVLVATLSTTVCDAILILGGAAGLGVLLDTVRPLRVILLAVGTVFLLYMAVRSLRTDHAQLDGASPPAYPTAPSSDRRWGPRC